MVDYKAYKHKQIGSIWVPFYIIKPDGQEILMGTSGTIIRELTQERLKKVKQTIITEEQFKEATQNIKISNPLACAKGAIYENAGCLFTVTEVHRLSNEEMRKGHLICNTRVVAKSPLYKNGPLNYGVNGSAQKHKIDRSRKGR